LPLTCEPSTAVPGLFPDGRKFGNHVGILPNANAMGAEPPWREDENPSSQGTNWQEAYSTDTNGSHRLSAPSLAAGSAGRGILAPFRELRESRAAFCPDRTL